MIGDEKKTVWVVTEGSYSDYRIVGVFDDREKANHFSRLTEGCEIETWTLNEPSGQQGRSGFEVFAYYGNSENGWCWREGDRGFTWWDAGKPSVVIRDDNREVEVLGTSREAALKILRDNVARLKAQQAGI